MSEESVGDAGASSLGYFGGCFSPEGRSIVAHGFTGALHLWHREGMTSGCPLLGAWCQEGQRCVWHCFTAPAAPKLLPQATCL